ncbi:MAG: metalloprotease family protein [Candidatus Aenigmatarchaeota archaeon]
MGIKNILNFITIPGVIIHEYGHKLFCDLAKVRVKKVCYFRFGDPVGYVIHEQPKNFFQTLLIVFGPFIFGTFFAVICYLYSYFYKGEISEAIFIWLGFSAAYNSFPSDADAKVLWNETNRYIRNNILAIIGYPFSLFIWLQNKLSYIYFDVIYAVLIYLIVYQKLLNITMLSFFA